MKRNADQQVEGAAPEPHEAVAVGVDEVALEFIKRRCRESTQARVASDLGIFTQSLNQILLGKGGRKAKLDHLATYARKRGIQASVFYRLLAQLAWELEMSAPMLARSVRPAALSGQSMVSEDLADADTDVDEQPATAKRARARGRAERTRSGE